MRKMFLVPAVALSSLFSTIGFAIVETASAQEAYASHGQQIVNTAKSYIGQVKYRYGTRDPQHLIFDCSSFTQFVFQKNGMNIPWGARAQTGFGTPVTSKSKLSVGDLVMFSVGTPGRIDHVGIYIGNGQFIGNSPSKGVAVYSMNTGYWSTRFITGRHY
ncbi:C40 family peptidase [Paenibacillus sp. P26]|nr:C40 family peptidase [Paenibacillus sp. P26]UUZ95567.1 C40 family peptidase [Paenibacillus sp. P25]